MLIFEYKLDGSAQQYQAIDEAIHITQFIRNKCLRLWMDERGISKNDLQCARAVLAKAYPFASLLNSQARQASADRCAGYLRHPFKKAGNVPRTSRRHNPLVLAS